MVVIGRSGAGLDTFTAASFLVRIGLERLKSVQKDFLLRALISLYSNRAGSIGILCWNP